MPGTDETQILTFTLSEDAYCVAIEYVAEIVADQDIRPLPDSDPHVKGVTDLRGETTTIVNPCDLLNVEADEVLTDGGQSRNRIIVLDSDAVGTDTPTGWLVSDVHEVTSVAEETLDADSVDDTDLMHGLISDDEGFTLWLDPHEFTT